MSKGAYAILIVVITIVAGAIGNYVVRNYFLEDINFDQELMKTSEELNKNCPFIIDQDTRLDNTIVLPGKKLVYNYTLINLSIDDLNVEELEQNLKPRILNNVKTNTDLRNFRENSVTMVYKYNDKDGIFIFEIIITPEEYN